LSENPGQLSDAFFRGSFDQLLASGLGSLKERSQQAEGELFDRLTSRSGRSFFESLRATELLEESPRFVAAVVVDAHGSSFYAM
jgi:hypothetical protein